MEWSEAGAIGSAIPERSYYNRTGLLGFVYHKASSSEDDEDQEVEIQDEEEEEQEEDEEQHEEQKEITEIKGDDDLQLEVEEDEEDSVEDIRYQLEMRRLVNAIRKLQEAKGEPMDKKMVFATLMKSDKLREFIMSPRESSLRPLKPHPREAELRKAIAHHKAKRDQYLQASQELDTHMSSYRGQSAASLQQREETENLLPLLPSEQQRPLSEPEGSSHDFTQRFQERWSISDSIAQACTAKLKEIEENFVQAKQQYKQDTLSSSTNDETPRTLFKAFKSQS